MEVTVQMRERFFDREAVISSIGPGRAKALAQLGGYIQKTAQRSMRRQKKPTPPGRPPAFHDSGSLTLRSIEFAFANNKQSLLIGPLRSNKRSGISIPRLHEFGGRAPIKEWKLIPQGQHTEKKLKRSKKLASQFNVWMHSGSKLVGSMNGMGKFAALPKDLQYRVDRRTRMARYPKRPYMRPAVKVARVKAPQLFRNIMKANRAFKKVKV